MKRRKRSVQDQGHNQKDIKSQKNKKGLMIDKEAETRRKRKKTTNKIMTKGEEEILLQQTKMKVMFRMIHNKCKS